MVAPPGRRATNRAGPSHWSWFSTKVRGRWASDARTEASREAESPSSQLPEAVGREDGPFPVPWVPEGAKHATAPSAREESTVLIHHLPASAGEEAILVGVRGAFKAGSPRSLVDRIARS